AGATFTPGGGAGGGIATAAEPEETIFDSRSGSDSVRPSSSTTRVRLSAVYCFATTPPRSVFFSFSFTQTPAFFAGSSRRYFTPSPGASMKPRYSSGAFAVGAAPAAVGAGMNGELADSCAEAFVAARRAIAAAARRKEGAGREDMTRVH